MKAFKNQNIYVEGKGIVKTDLVFNNKIVSIGESAECEIINLPLNAVVLPGFIDEHIHGAGGADAMDGNVQALQTISKTLAQEGTTSFLATTMTQSKEKINKSLNGVGEIIGKGDFSGARILGVHLEGPFISKEYKGAQSEEYILAPNLADFKEFYKNSLNNIKIVTIAPEAPNASELISFLNSLGIVASIGHSNASIGDVQKALNSGATCVTHTFNAQSKLHHRDIGVVGGALLYDDLCCELICDLIHVSKEAIQLLVKNKPKDKLILITDTMRAKGLGDCESELGGQKVVVKNGEARLLDGTLAGSVLQMNRAIQNLVQKVGVSLTQAVDYASINPAKNLKLDSEIGSIKVGKRADFTILNENFDVLLTIRDGEVIYKNY